MKLENLSETKFIEDANELKKCLAARTKHNDNAFWLNNNASTFPQLSIMIKENTATLQYLPKDGHPGFLSLGNLGQTDDVKFRISESPADDLLIASKFLITTTSAEIAAIEFFEGKSLPNSVEWMEL